MSTARRWVTKDSSRTPELDELIRLACTGERWDALSAVYYPGRKNGHKTLCGIFTERATEEEQQARRDALIERGFNKPAVYAPRVEAPPASPRERTDPWADMGECFGRNVAARDGGWFFKGTPPDTRTLGGTTLGSLVRDGEAG